ncbi:MAG TPA: AI-2E family transporter [Candidatus Levybacteria bacterium]|nr:AI-2E family transporter [Candidatus Levybacteria bacterium]
MEAVENSIKNIIIKNQIVVALLLVVLGWFIIQIKEILILFFISYILMAALKPYVSYLTKFKIPRTVAIALLYVLTLGVVVLLIVPIIPFFSSQISSLIVSFPKYLDDILHALRINIQASQMQEFLTSQFDTITSNAFAVTGAILGSIFSLFLVFVVSFYLMQDENRVKKELMLFFPKKDKEKAMSTMAMIEEKLGAWFRGQLVLCFTIGLLTWIALTVISFPFALPLALLAGLLEIVPTIGPILSAVPAVIVALSISPGLAFTIIIIYIVIQMIENNVLVPKVMQKAVGLNPIVIILAITIGAKLLGLMGALLCIPFISMIIIIIKNMRKE